MQSNLCWYQEEGWGGGSRKMISGYKLTNYKVSFHKCMCGESALLHWIWLEFSAGPSFPSLILSLLSEPSVFSGSLRQFRLNLLPLSFNSLAPPSHQISPALAGEAPAGGCRLTMRASRQTDRPRGNPLPSMELRILGIKPSHSHPVIA